MTWDLWQVGYTISKKNFMYPYPQEDHVRKISKERKESKYVVFYLLTLEIRTGTWQSNCLFPQSTKHKALDLKTEVKRK